MKGPQLFRKAQSNPIHYHRSKRTIFISWAPYCSRSDFIAKEMGGVSYLIYHHFFGSNYYTIALKYITQTMYTLYILLKKRPKIIFTMSPPVFACIPVFFYCKLTKSTYIIDAHTGTFFNPMWKNVLFLQKFFCKNALLNLVTNETLGDILENWNAPYHIVPDVPIKPTSIASMNLKEGTNIMFINSFASDEPLDEFVCAAKQLPDINFYITGKIPKSERWRIDLQEPNIVYTDFIDYSMYYGLMAKSDLIVVLTKKDNTMQRGAYEAIYLEKPVVTSDWEILRLNFPKGAVFVDNSPIGIIDGIKAAIENIDELKNDALILRKLKLSNWEANKYEIDSKIMSYFNDN